MDGVPDSGGNAPSWPGRKIHLMGANGFKDTASVRGARKDSSSPASDRVHIFILFKEKELE